MPIGLTSTTLGQAADAPRPLWQVLLDNGLPLTILFIFLVAVVGVVLKARRKDKCLKLLAGYHVTLLTKAGASLWGDLVVYSQGLELGFDAPYITRRGLTKASALLYPKQIEGMLAICRIEEGLTEKEKAKRRRQVRRSFKPGPIRRTLRWFRNLLNTLRDAFSKAMSAIIGSLAKARPGSSVLSSQQGQVTAIGDTLLGAAANAYEPMLEAHVGKPVVVEVASDADPTKAPVEIEGYLVDYTDQFVSVFNVDHRFDERFTLEASEDHERPNVSLAMTPTDAKVTCIGPEALVVRTFRSGETFSDLRLVLLPGCSVCLRREAEGPVSLELATTRTLDITAPRSIAKVYFGSESRGARSGWRGAAPQRESATPGSAVSSTGV